MFIPANRVKHAAVNPGLAGAVFMEEADTQPPAVVEWDGPPDDDKKALTVHIWTPGLVLDYAQALSMLADPRPTGWFNTTSRALKKMFRRRVAMGKGKSGDEIHGD